MTLTYPPLQINANQANWGLKTCYFYFGIAAPLVIGAYLIIPETARRSPAELDELYDSGVKTWGFSKTVTKIQRDAMDSSGTPSATASAV